MYQGYQEKAFSWMQIKFHVLFPESNIQWNLCLKRISSPDNVVFWEEVRTQDFWVSILYFMWVWILSLINLRIKSVFSLKHIYTHWSTGKLNRKNKQGKLTNRASVHLLLQATPHQSHFLGPKRWLEHTHTQSTSVHKVPFYLFSASTDVTGTRPVQA